MFKMFSMKNLFILFLAFCTSLFAITSEEIDQLVERTRTEWEIPAISVAIVHKGSVKVAGYGTRSKGEEALVDADTLFQINSLTKAFTALTVNMLVEEGRLNLDAPITTYLPQFSLKDKSVAEAVTLRDLLSHRTGLPGNKYLGGKLWRETARTKEDLFARLALTDLSLPFRTRFNYDNLGYKIVGEIVEAVTGTPWTEFCTQRILSPLHMERSTFSYAAFLEDPNSAKPHQHLQNVPCLGYDWEKDHMEPAAGLISSATDMAKWLQFCLKDPSIFGEAFKSHICVHAEDQFYPSDALFFPVFAHGHSHLEYGFGWYLYQLENRKVYRHTGSCKGMQSQCVLIPEEELGIIILSNESSHNALTGLLNQLIDRYLERPDSDWQTQARIAFLENKRVNKERVEKKELERTGMSALPLDAYVGTYTHPVYGSIAITFDNDQLQLEELFSEAKGTLKPWDANHFEVKGLFIAPPPPFLIEFIREGDAITGLLIPDMGLFQ